MKHINKQFLLLLTIFICSSPALNAQELMPEDAFNTERSKPSYNNDSQRIFSQSRKSVYQIRVINKKSGQKSAIGSGFRVNPNGFFITNYHVVSQAVIKADEYSLEYLDNEDNYVPLKIRNINVVHDLAVLEPMQESTERRQDYLNFSNHNISKGTTIFSMGNPHDLGMTIIQGLYNGLLEKSLYQKILFSGAINGGMSGGPALDEAGKVIGVNVARSGDDLGYLVPQNFVQDLLHQEPPEKEWKEVVKDQLIQNSQKTVAKLLSQKWATKNFNEFKIPKNIDISFKCWGSGKNEGEDESITKARLICETQDSLYISSYLETGKIEFSVTKIESSLLNKFAFSDYYSRYYKYPLANLDNKSTEDVKEFSCESDFVSIAQQKWKVALCARPYKKYEGLYDVLAIASLMGRSQEGYIIEVFMDGFAKPDAQNFMKEFLETVQ